MISNASVSINSHILFLSKVFARPMSNHPQDDFNNVDYAHINQLLCTFLIQTRYR